MEHEIALRDTLSANGNLELRFRGGQSIRVHSRELKLASSVLKALLNDVMDDQIALAASQRKISGASSGEGDMPSLHVGWWRLRIFSYSLANPHMQLRTPLLLTCPAHHAHST